MKDEIKEIERILATSEKYITYAERCYVLDYITNLREKNKKLKVKLNCKEYFSSTMPEDAEFVILTKENYDRQQKDIELELIDYKQRNEKAIEYIKKTNFWGLYEDTPMIEVKYGEDLLNILNGGSNE